jgi:hypothetical protein
MSDFITCPITADISATKVAHGYYMYGSHTIHKETARSATIAITKDIHGDMGAIIDRKPSTGRWGLLSVTTRAYET